MLECPLGSAPCEYKNYMGRCSVTGCRKLFSITYEAHSMTPLTNDSYFNSLSPEEKAAFLARTDFCEILCPKVERCTIHNCEEKLTAWLKSPRINY